MWVLAPWVAVSVSRLMRVLWLREDARLLRMLRCWMQGRSGAAALLDAGAERPRKEGSHPGRCAGWQWLCPCVIRKQHKDCCG